MTGIFKKKKHWKVELSIYISHFSRQSRNRFHQPRYKERESKERKSKSNLISVFSSDLSYSNSFSISSPMAFRKNCGLELLLVASLTLTLALINNLVEANSDGDALYALRLSLTDPEHVLQSWDPNLVTPCTWFHVSCNQDNRVTRV